jgi:hypothetical protein
MHHQMPGSNTSENHTFWGIIADRKNLCDRPRRLPPPLLYRNSGGPLNFDQLFKQGLCLQRESRPVPAVGQFRPGRGLRCPAIMFWTVHLTWMKTSPVVTQLVGRQSCDVLALRDLAGGLVSGLPSVTSPEM